MESLIRLSIALTVFIVMVSLEYFIPRRQPVLTRQQRWPVNLGLALTNMVLMRFTIGSLAFLTAVHVQQMNWGVLNQVALPYELHGLLSVLLLDLAIYIQHVISHKWQPLWRLHQVHHTDLEFDATTAVRFHPLEIWISMLYKAAWIVILGADPQAVIVFEVILNGAATFNHSNIHIPTKLDKILRGLLITPDVHRIHHSTLPAETDSNYGFSISLWDRLFGTYIAEPQSPQTEMAIGLAPYRKPEQLKWFSLLLLPFKKPS
jgi:sterol desaturase/sphingolipid hydroxylase (fatty acid hydroxylase superfamily)